MQTTPPLLSLTDISLGWGGAPVLDGLELHIAPQDRLCLIGRNGEGKSTLLRVIAGEVEADSGSRWVQPGTRLATLPQEPDTRGYDRLADYVIDGLPEDERFETYRADALMDALQVKADMNPATASGGEVRRAALARTLVSAPDLLLLDEPTNHLDIATITWLEDWLKAWRGALVLISHDRAFLGALSSACLWLDRGRIRRLEAGFDQFESWQETVLEQERVDQAKLDKKISEEARWAVEGITARRKRNQGRLRNLQAMRHERAEQRASTGSVTFAAASAGTSGKRVIEARNIAKSYDGRTLFSDFSTRILRGDRVGMIGPNGAGKSTLLGCLTGTIQPDAGEVIIGTNLDIVRLDQKRAELKPDDTIRGVLTGGRGDMVSVGGESRHVRSYMKDYLFDPSQADTPVESLSGGERGRLLLAAGFARPSNLLVLDEPTNDLDMDTLDLLQETLADYPGTVLLISHDRDFLDRVVTSTIVLEGDGTATEYAGGYSDCRRQKAGADAIVAEHSQDSATITPIKPRKAKEPGKRANKSRKLSYKDQLALDTLPAEVESLNGEIQRMEADLGDPALYRNDPDRFHRLSDEIERKKTALEDMEMRWLELEEKREALEE
ncbi:ATP-binding cassette domain-containing protein [Yunchengibacter salinarum]|uniref:ATP-binding cassette domain-containing protein n=1 Tax=Yunchengibacter salinarum TaxID=3133399 RepID=UPI0035B638AA